MRFVVLGSGAVGGSFGGLLAKAGQDVFFMARGKHLDAMKSRGLEIEGPNQHFTVPVRASDQPGDAGSWDALLVCVKSYDTESASRPFVAGLAPASVVVSLQNGLGNVEKLESIFPKSQVVPGVAYVGSELVRPGVIRWETGGRLIIGPSPRSADIQAAFDKAGVPVQVVADIEQAVWEKLVANAVFNVLATIENCSLGDLLKEPLRETGERAIDELAAVAAAQGVVVRPVAREHCWDFCTRFPNFRTSTQQDRDRGGRNEAEALNGELIRRGREAGVPTPTLEKMYDALKRIG